MCHAAAKRIDIRPQLLSPLLNHAVEELIGEA